MAERDYRSEPFEVMVALGESTVAGACASKPQFRWVNVVADLIGEFQEKPVTLHNKGIGANAISPRSPGYERSAKPSALERYKEDVIALKPDLFILAYGLNDMRARMAPEDFREDMQTIITDVKENCNPVTVLTTVYHMSAYDLYPPYDRGSPEATKIYNEVIRQLAESNDCLLADVYAAEGRADWLIHPDTVHANDLGHRIIGHRVFEVIARNCSCVAARLTQELAEDKAQVEATMDQRKSLQNYDNTCLRQK